MVHNASPAAAAAPTAAWQRVMPGWDRSSSPTVADINGDGVPDVVFGHQNGYLYALDGRTGRELPGWPRFTGAAVDSTAAVADLDGHGHPSIIVGVGSTWHPRTRGGLLVFNASGRLRCRWEPPEPPGGPSWSEVFSSPAIGDVDGDGHPDIVFGGFDLQIHAIDRNCHELSGFPFWDDDTVWSSPSLYDINGDGRMDIFIGSDSSPGGPQPNQGGVFRALTWRNGRVVQLWEHETNDVISSSPAIADINGDGRPDVVVGGGNYWHGSDGHRVWAWDAATGAQLKGWPQTFYGVTGASPAIGDLQGNGARDVVVATRSGWLYALRGNGRLLWVRKLKRNDGSMSPVYGSPVIADVNGDGHEDIAVTTDFSVHLIDGRNGTDLVPPFLTNWSFETAPTFYDMGRTRYLVVAGFSTLGQKTVIGSFPVGAAGEKASWPTFKKNARHIGAPPSGGHILPSSYCRAPTNPHSEASVQSSTGYWFLSNDGGVFAFGRAPYRGSPRASHVRVPTTGIVPSRTGNGYWVLFKNGAVYSYGDARYHGSMAGRRLHAPIVRMARTASGRGYYLLASDGGVFAFGDARFYGSTGRLHLHAPIISMAVTPSGRGYWLLASDGGVFAFGDARFYGSTGRLHLHAPIISMAVRPQGNGYWLLARDGGVFSFGAAAFRGSIPGTGLCAKSSAVQVRATNTGAGYWLLSSDGGVFSFGDARFFGSAPGLGGSRQAVDMAIR
jgi:hypothetical protein